MNGTFIRDVIHGYIEISPICMKIINTPEFQRLRNIKQLSFVSFVYPSANHTRFEHCIGVSYLAGKMARQLLSSNIDDYESWIKCAEIAGLCHDLGHGPFSHFYEEYINLDFKHEKESVRLFEKICASSPFNIEIKEHEREKIIAMILPKDNKYVETMEKKKLGFMFQIVSNEENGIDVDKWDYLQRDAFYLGFTSVFEYIRLLSHAKVYEVKGKMKICYALKLKDQICEMYRFRQWHHEHAYQHRVALCINEMVSDALKESEVDIKSSDTDAVYYTLRDKSELIKRVESRDLYNSLGGIPHRKLFPDMPYEKVKSLAIEKFEEENPGAGELSKQQRRDAIKTYAIKRFKEKFNGARKLNEKQLIVACDGKLYKEQASDAPKEVHFYMKLSPTEAGKTPQIQVSQLFSEEEITYYFFFKTKDDDSQTLQNVQALKKEILDSSFPKK